MTAILPRHCGACVAFAPPDDKQWRFRRHHQRAGKCRKLGEPRMRDAACCERYVSRSETSDPAGDAVARHLRRQLELAAAHALRRSETSDPAGDAVARHLRRQLALAAAHALRRRASADPQKVTVDS